MPKIQRRRLKSFQAIGRAAVPAIFTSELVSKVATRLRVDPTLILLASNLAVFSLWKAPSMQDFLMDHFTRQSRDIGQKHKLYQFLTSGFSHDELDHLFNNMFTLALLGPRVCRMMGIRRFSYFYVGSLYAADLFCENVYWPKYKRARGFLSRLMDLWPSFALGASGGICSIEAYYCLKFAREYRKLQARYNFWDIVRWFFKVAELLDEVSEPISADVGHGAHVGGIFFGVGFFVASELGKAAFTMWQKWKTKRSQLRKTSLATRHSHH